MRFLNGSTSPVTPAGNPAIVATSSIVSVVGKSMPNVFSPLPSSNVLTVPPPTKFVVAPESVTFISVLLTVALGTE